MLAITYNTPSGTSIFYLKNYQSMAAKKIAESLKLIYGPNKVKISKEDDLPMNPYELWNKNWNKL